MFIKSKFVSGMCNVTMVYGCGYERVLNNKHFAMGSKIWYVRKYRQSKWRIVRMAIYYMY